MFFVFKFGEGGWGGQLTVGSLSIPGFIPWTTDRCSGWFLLLLSGCKRGFGFGRGIFYAWETREKAQNKTILRISTRGCLGERGGRGDILERCLAPKTKEREIERERVGVVCTLRVLRRPALDYRSLLFDFAFR